LHFLLKSIAKDSELVYSWVQLAEKAMKKRAAVESNPPHRYLIFLTKTQPFLSPLCFE
jgi:hypothetical protein